MGSALALEIISTLEKDGFKIKNYFAGASIPPKKPIKRNIWNICPNNYIHNRLTKAGAPLNGFSSDVLAEFLTSFRKDTSFANLCYVNKPEKINATVTVILSKNDIFTKNYKNTEKHWKRYVKKLEQIHFIDTQTHYFQTHNHRDVAEIILSTK